MSLIDNDLVVQSLNFHGNNLTAFLKNYPEFQDLDLKHVNYGIYQSRSKELRTEDRGQRLLLHQFISQNLLPIFRKQENSKSHLEESSDQKRDDAIAIMPPMESFCKVPEEDRSIHFFDLISLHDILLCRVSAKNVQGLLLNVLGFTPGCGKSRYIRDLRHKAFCPSEELLPNQVRPYEIHDVVCVYVVEVRKESQRLLVSMKSDLIKDEDVRKKLEQIKFGQYEKDSLPTVYLYTEQVLDRRLSYNEVLEKNLGFPNPSNVEVLTEELGLSNYAGQSSLFSSLQHQFPSSKTAPALRKAQASKMAFKHVATGIKHFKANNHVEAFQCLNQALQIDPENVEALVARGALYANRSNLETAIKDFEAALKHNAFHKNARKYMCETLFALGREHEDELKEEEALKYYERILEINPDHQGAQEAVNKIKGIFKDAQELDIDLKAFGNNKEMAEKFREFIIAEREKKKSEASRSSRSPIRSVSPFSQKVSLVNPSSLMAPGTHPTANERNISEDPEAHSSQEKPTAAILQQDFSVPPPNFVPSKSAQDLAYEQKVADFLQKTTTLDAKIQQHLQPRKRRTFTDFPMPCSSSGASKAEADVVETRTVSYKSPQRESSKIVYDSAMGLYKKVPDSPPERIVKKVSKSPSPPPRKHQSSKSSNKRSRSRSRGGDRRRSRSKSRDVKSRRSRSISREARKRSRSRDRRRSRSRSRGDRRERKRSRSRDRTSRRRSRSPMTTRYPSPHKRRRSDDGLHELMSETDKIKLEREQIRKEKEQLLKLSQQKKDPILDSLPRPVPLRSAPPSTSTSSYVKKERKEISMKVKTSGGKILEDKKWEVEDDDDDDEELEVAKAMESVRKAVDGGGNNKARPGGKPIDPATASKILPGARNYQDIEKYLNQAKKEKLDLLKKKNKW